jgi:transglutaminase-like putative cysteine protease
VLYRIRGGHRHPDPCNTIRYSYNPPKYDAIYTLKAGSGNCQNLAQYSLALLRAAGIPARIVGGITLSNPWQVTLENGQSWVQRMGEGAHAWIEIYFPDLGWLSNDPLYSRQFTPTRHVKQTHGLEVMDVNDYWLSEPNQPGYREKVSAKFQEDRVTVKLALPCTHKILRPC